MKTNLSNYLKKGMKSMKLGWNKHGQLIMAGITIITAVGAVYEAIKATSVAEEIKATREVALDDLSLQVDNNEITAEEYEEKKREINFTAAKKYTVCYASTAILLTSSVAATVLNYKTSMKKQAMLFAAYKLANDKKEELEKKAKEVIGEKEFNKIKGALVKDHLDKAELPEEIKNAEHPEYAKDPKSGLFAADPLFPCWLDAVGQPFLGNTTLIRDGLSLAAEYCKANEGISIDEICDSLKEVGCVGLHHSELGENHGFIPSMLTDNKTKIGYYTTSVTKEGYDRPFLCVLFDEKSVLLGGMY